ncbi:vacuolar calcium ion transporter [Verticillium alfalfae VaMs.102]|uniref:Vacuolar calcium ion transporter n=1 Tax=Verticillium alfalfae (strain VaMs.102 / ATCC MYA-4576 / FGSC 10136) TaxID=526221 RepID=C9ST15_VERA1|nr:vacuolar calcium ion transporter [Verticillium alfalfae VaMs.102]EEY21930.1 vacuolar calcium ion transporter [Verticillium alfalfae VaMs.102]
MADNNTANVSFREQVRRTWDSNTSKPVSDAGREDGASESSPLLGNGSGQPHLRDADGDEPRANGHSRNKTVQFFFDTERTPGSDSDNVFVKYSAYTWHVTKVTLLSNYVNFLLFMVPLGIVAGKMGWGATAVFTINFFAIIPLAAVLSYATEQISMKLGESLGGLLNATFGNAVELIVSIVALKDGQIEVVQSSMLGSILSTCCLSWACASSSVASSTCATLRPASAWSRASPRPRPRRLARSWRCRRRRSSSPLRPEKEHSILVLSRGTAITLLVLYVMYLWFQLRTHPNLFDSEVQLSEEETEEPAMGPVAAGLVLVVTTVLVAICADYLVGSIDDIVEEAHISKNFIGLILIPIVGNAAEHHSIALLVTPFLVILGWAVLDQPMTLHFETFETVAFAFSVLVVTYTVQDGKSNYLEGAMLLGLYFIIALAFYVSPSDAMDKALNLVSR